MKKIFSIFMTIVFAVTLGLFITLGIIVIILGPEKTEKAIKSLFRKETYIISYKKLLPFPKGESEKRVIEDSGVVVGITRDIRDLSQEPPLFVPTSGITPSRGFLFVGPLSEGKHEGVDVWTNSNGTGMDGKTYHQGSPVYAACSGVVKKVWKENGDVSIICDELDEIYEDKVPSRHIKTLYGHMADRSANTNETFIYVHEGQQVNKGDLIGHQGNRCFWAPQNIMVHLHFGIYDITKQQQVPLDPTPYIGVSCTTLNQKFVAGIYK